MAFVDFRNNAQTFDFTVNHLTFNTAFSLQLSSVYSWFTATASVDFTGSGFTYDDGGNPTGGTITGLTVNLGADTPLAELDVSGLGSSLTALSGLRSLSEDQQNDLMWRTVLAGDDKVRFGNGVADSENFIKFAGDGRNVEAGQSLEAGRDNVAGEIGGGEVFGDFYSVTPAATLFGGDDKLAASGNGGGYIYGDTGVVDGILHGGSDQILADRGISVSIGDASVINEGAQLFGGGDRISMQGAGTTFGDAIGIWGTARGGSDRITGSTVKDTIWGDFSHVYATGFVVGGKDVLHGGGGNDIIFGDWFTVDDGASAIGGKDRLFGDAGKDRLLGGGGADILDGGTGADHLFGGSGSDTFLFALGSGKDTIHDFAAAGKTHDIINIAHLKGLDSFAEAKAHFEKHGADLWIDAGHGDVLILQKVAMHDLGSGDFAF